MARHDGRGMVLVGLVAFGLFPYGKSVLDLEACSRNCRADMPTCKYVGDYHYITFISE